MCNARCMNRFRAQLFDFSLRITACVHARKILFYDCGSRLDTCEEILATRASRNFSCIFSREWIMIVEERIYTVQPGKAGEYAKLMETEGIAIQEPIL